MNISNCEKKMKAYIIDKRLGHYTQISHHFFALLIDLRRFSTFESSISYNQISILTAPYQILFLVCWEFRWFQIVWWASSTYSLQQNDAFKFYPIIQNDPRGEIWERRRRKTTQEQKAECSNLAFLGTKYHTKTGFQRRVQVNRLTAHPKENLWEIRIVVLGLL